MDPFSALGNAIGKVVVDSWTLVMIATWKAALVLLGWVLSFEDFFLSPNITTTGPMVPIYQVTLWIALAMGGVLVMVQIGVVLLRRTGESLGQLAWGVGQFVLVWAAWFSYAAAVLAAAAGLTRALT
ncbi:MAG: hypothetical protein L0H26_10585, partial [Microlunatus sp.]|nr:hypothetical protein [Microlunatus sp.]